MGPKKSMRILGIDPGTALLGYGIIDSDGTTYRAVAFGTCRTPAKQKNRDRVLPISDFFDNLIKKYQPEKIALESIFFFKNNKTVIGVSEIRGVLLLVAARHGLAVMEFTPLQLKQGVSGYGRADKAQVQKMVKLILNLTTTPKPDDVADALALAICAANTIVYWNFNHARGLRDRTLVVLDQKTLGVLVGMAMQEKYLLAEEVEEEKDPVVVGEEKEEDEDEEEKEEEKEEEEVI